MARARGWCLSHWKRWRKYGDPSGFTDRQRRPCSIAGCGQLATSRGWCAKHYSRWQKHGDPLWVRPSAEQRFWAKVIKDGPLPVRRPELGPCWLWTDAPNSDGYGIFYESSKRRLGAHRFAYELLKEPIPARLQLDHLCRNRICVNPAHLEPVTNRINVLRGEGFAAVNAAKTHCPQGHEYTPENTYVYPKTGGRVCRACNRERQRKSYRARKLAAA